MPHILRDSEGNEIGRSATQIILTGDAARSLDETWLSLPAGCTVEVAPDPEPVPAEVTMRQARRALLDVGMLELVPQKISLLPEPQRSRALIDWEYSSTVQRHNGFVAALAPMLGLNDAALDALFIAASKVPS